MSGMRTERPGARYAAHLCPQPCWVKLRLEGCLGWCEEDTQASQGSWTGGCPGAFQAQGSAPLWGRWAPTCPHSGTDTPSEGDCISWALANTFMCNLWILVLSGLSVFPEKPEIWHFIWNCLILKKNCVSNRIWPNVYRPPVNNSCSIFFPHHVLISDKCF